MTMQTTNTAPPHSHAGEHLAMPDCAHCGEPMRLRTIAYTAQRQTMTFECTTPACLKQVARCSVDS